MYMPGQPKDIGPYCRQLLELASSNWTPHDCRLACVMNGWMVEDLRYDPGIKVQLEDGLHLAILFSGNKGAPYGVVIVYYHYEGNYERDVEFYDFGQEDFDQAFEIARATMSRRLGHPEVQGEHTFGWACEEPRYQFSIWRGKRGILVLQQGEIDLHGGGVDVSVCLHPWEESRPTPRIPLLVNGAD